MIPKMVMNYMAQRPLPADAPLSRWLLSYIVGLSGGLIIGYILFVGIATTVWGCHPDFLFRCLIGHQPPERLLIPSITGGFFGGICGTVIRQLFIIFPKISIQSILYGILGVLSWPIFMIFTLVFIDMMSTRKTYNYTLVAMLFVGITIGASWAAINYVMMKQKQKQKWIVMFKQYFTL